MSAKPSLLLTFLTALSLICGSTGAAPSVRNSLADDLVGSVISYEGQEIAPILPPGRLDHILITNHNETRTRFPPQSYFLDPLNEALKEQTRFSDLTTIPEGAGLLWRGYVAPAANHILQIDYYFGEDGLRFFVISDGFRGGILIQRSAISKILRLIPGHPTPSFEKKLPIEPGH
jgi:hypothetical protein